MFKRARAEIFDRNREVGISNVTTAASLVTFPVLAGILGGVVPSVRTPSAAMVSGVQHFAAGIVMAAVAGEVLPDLRSRGPLWLIVVASVQASRYSLHCADLTATGNIKTATTWANCPSGSSP